ncbi:hypothetical protein [Rothia mucilaginosa]|uniref:hypothetical protein n=1 Tax=Rothia mucilaginosa TaxID=43675 RepID=UPI002059AED6|nr:hypothetical protein [Rothia mucilaginosa]UQF83925.1 MAG: hypothetical protein M3I37_08650 [Rothia mucilaginosa]
MTYITGAIYPSGDRIRIGAPEEETLNAYQQPNTAVALGYANPDIHELHALQKPSTCTNSPSKTPDEATSAPN